MKLLTLNTHSIVEPNYEHKLEIFVREISRIRPDIIALQEVNQTHTAQVVELQNYGGFEAQIKSDNHVYRAVQMLGSMGINYHWCYLPVKRGYDIYDEGLAVLSRYPITGARSILLSRTDDYSNWRTRKALVVTTDNNDAGIICNVHMGWWEDEEEPFAGQWDRLKQQLPDGAVWLMGDFNSPDSKQGQGYDLIESDGWIDVYRCAQSDEGSTVPGVIDGWKGCAPKRIDYIWHNTMPVVESCKVCFKQQSVSDHYGVVAQVQSGNRFKRSAGILMPVFSLPSEYGIGCFDECAYRFVDFLVKSGQSYWQILPLVSTSYGDSPYQSFSSFAGNPYFISLGSLVKAGLLDKHMCSDTDFGNNKCSVDYAKLYRGRYKLLKMAYGGWSEDEGYRCFCKDNAYWLEDYALFMAIKERFGGKPWYEWDTDIKIRQADAVEFYQKELENTVGFYKFVQYMFFTQWHKLKSYANDNGVKIIGDMPIYVAYDSADCWANTHLFQLDCNLEPVSVAGCPPDGFSATGQLWGNPLYNWKNHSDTGYAWWKQRIYYTQQLYDVVRLDHFRGFDEYYAVPYGSPDAVCGRWEQGPGYELFDALNKAAIKCRFIAEDLGFITDGVRALLEECGFPGMKILQFAFDSRDSSGNDHIPYRYHINSVVYTGTHDNHTLRGWYDSITDEEKQFVKNYFGISSDSDVIPGMISGAMGSVCDLCIIPVADWLGLDDSARINTPSTSGGNWTWRLSDMDILEKLGSRIFDTTKLYGR